MTGWHIVALTPELCADLAECHVACWREAYRGIVYDAVLDALDVGQCTRMWRERLAGPARAHVAVADGGVIGFAFAGPVAADDVQTQLYALYVRRAFHGTGVADALLGAAIGTAACRLWVFETNTRAHAFYRRHGFELDGSRQREGFSAIFEVRMCRSAQVPAETRGGGTRYGAAMTEYVSVEEGVLTIVISTAANGTALDFDGIRAGTAALAQLDPAVGAIVVAGAGKNFSAGGNVRDFAAESDRGATLRTLADDLHAFTLALQAAPVPVVLGAQGWAAGAGMSMVCLADIAIGGPATRLRAAYPGIGFTPDGGMTWSLPRIVGISRAREIILTNAVVEAQEAVRLGILSRLVERDEDVPAEAVRIARELAKGPRGAYAATRELFTHSATRTLAEQLEAEAVAISAAADSADGREGVDAFLAKRQPAF